MTSRSEDDLGPLFHFRPTHPLPYGGAVPSAPGSATSRAAADAIEGKHGAMVAECYALITKAGDRGMTREDLGVALDRPTSDVCAAVRWLYLRGYIGPEGTRETRRGHAADVMKAHGFVMRWRGMMTRAERIEHEKHLTKVTIHRPAEHPL